MGSPRVECLACFAVRVRVEDDACGRCGYLGWAPLESLSETDRRLLRECPPEQRARPQLLLVSALVS